MSHTIQQKKRLLDRVKRIRGQIEGIEKSLHKEDDPSKILQNIAACRGAINGLMAEVLEGHVDHHVLDPDSKPTTEQTEAAELLVKLIRTYLK